MKINIDIPEQPERLETFTDDHLAFLWHVAQHNPAPISDEMAGRVAEHIGREIVRRWVKKVEPTLWNHQGRHHYWSILESHGQWLPVNGDDNNRQWTPNKQEAANPELLRACEQVKYLLAVARDHGYGPQSPELQQAAHLVREALEKARVQ